MILLALPESSLPLAVGTALALGALALVLAPLLGDTSTDSATTATRQRSDRDAASNTAINGAVAALREIEFDRETGKLSDSDYVDLKRRYTQAAIDEMRAAKVAADVILKPAEIVAESRSNRAVEVAAARVDVTDLAEAAIERARAQQKICTTCGPRPEPDALYCSDCGGYLAGQCRACGSAIEDAGSRFCSHCGEPLAAL